MFCPLKSRLGYVLFTSLICAIPQLSKADVLAGYGFPASSTYVSTDTNTASTASDFTFSGMGILGTDYGRSTAGSGTNFNTIYTRGTELTTSESAAVAGGDYYSFTLAPGIGQSINLTSLTFVTDATQGLAGITYTANFVIRSSLDGYAANISAFSDGPSISNASTFTLNTIDLSGAAFQNIQAPVTFRIYLYHTGANALNTAAITRSDTYILNGTVGAAVPEPSTIGLVGTGLALFFLRRRKSA